MIDFTDLLSVPYLNKGRDVDVGLDCYGLVKEVFRRYGIEIEEYDIDARNAREISKTIKNVNASHWEKVSIKDLTAPTAIAIRLGIQDGIVNHTGVYIGNGRFIQMRKGIGVTIDRIDSPIWRKCIVNFYKWKGSKQ